MQQDGKNILVIDIGSGSVGLALIISGKKNTVNFSSRFELDYGAQAQFDTLLAKMLAGIERALGQVPKGVIDETQIFLHSPWHTVHTQKCSLNENKKFTLTEKILEQASYDEIANFMTEAKVNFPGYEQLKIVESTIPEIKINGYTVEKPFGKKITNCEFLVSLALSPEDIILSITDVCSKVLNLNKKHITFHSATIAFAHLCGNLYNENNGIMIVDVGSEITDVTLVKNKAVSSGSSFAQGSHDIVRTVSQTLGTSFNDAVSKSHASFSGVSAKDLSGQIIECLKPLEITWQKAVSQALLKISTIENIPKTVILICEDMRLTPWYVETIKADTFTQYLRTDGKFVTISPNIDALKNNLIINTSSYIDASIGLLCIAI